MTMREQRGVPPFVDAIRFDHRQRATEAGPPTANRRRLPPAASTHRVGHSIGTHPEDAPYSTDEGLSSPARVVAPPRQSQTWQEADEADDDYDYRDEPRHTRSHTTSRRLDHNLLQTRDLSPRWRRFNAGGLVALVGAAALIMLLGWLALSALGTWWLVHQDDLTYGRPRTFQTDAVVGHHGDSVAHPSHFLALNLARQVVVVEIPAADPSKAILYSGPTLMGDGQDLTPVTLTFADVNGDGKLDMQVHLLDQVIIYLNTGSKFVAQQQHP